jgi:hypothetical protein
VWAIDVGGSNNSHIYIDGVIDHTITQSKTAKSSPWYIGKDLWVNSLPAANFFNGDLDEIAIYNNILLTPTQVLAHYTRGSSTHSDVVTVPKAGSSIALTYYRKQPSSARVKSTASIALETERYRDNGVRQRIYRVGDTTPTPRNSTECLALAQATMNDALTPRYEGTYSFQAVVGTQTELRFWPWPGDRVPCYIQLPSGDKIDQLLSIQQVSSDFLGNGAYNIKLGFGPINRFDIVIRNLILKRKSSLDNPVIADTVAETLEVINESYPYPADVLDCTVTSITATDFAVQLAQTGIPADVVNYEVREDDTGWGSPTYIARFHATTHTFTRVKRDLRYFIRPYNSSGQYSKRSAFVRVACPTANAFVMSGVTGDVSSQRIRVVIPIPRDPDYYGMRLQQTDANGPIYYQGNGLQHEILGTGVAVLLTAGFMTIDIPNPANVGSFTAFVNMYNLLNLFGTGQTVTISVAAPGAFTTTTYSGGDYTANGAMTWTVGAGDVVTSRWTQNVSTMDFLLNLQTTTVGGTPNTTLQVAIPNGLTAKSDMSDTCVISDNGTRVVGTMSVATGGTTVNIQRLDRANFAASTNNTDVQGSITFEV